MIVKCLKGSGHVWDNKRKNPRVHTPAWFKVATTILHLAQGGTWWQTGFCSGVLKAVLHMWAKQTCTGIVEVLHPVCMRKPTLEEAQLNQDFFSHRRGIMNVGGAVNGTHVPWQPDDVEFAEHFHNYKGWYNILVVGLVNNHYMFMDAEVGRPGRMANSIAT
mmetsp:Transcript_26141/g.73206  ORF Transcript_26141/g.73206 Transcript_26141/m.73206 type:complete len:162 (-) Transcript_26141:86-571(-)